MWPALPAGCAHTSTALKYLQVPLYALQEAQAFDEDGNPIEGEEEEGEEVSVQAEDYSWYWRIDDSEANPHFEPSRMDILGMTADHFSSPRAD